MPTLTIDGKTQEFPTDKRLVLAIEEMGINIGHRCGGKGRCTTCRVTFEGNAPDDMTQAEYDKLKEADLLGEVRLSCQLMCAHDWTVNVLMTQETEDWPNTGPEPATETEPEAKWIPLKELGLE